MGIDKTTEVHRWLRIGYLAADAAMADMIRRTCVVYSVNAIAQEAALACLQDGTGHIAHARAGLRKPRLPARGIDPAETAGDRRRRQLSDRQTAGKRYAGVPETHARRRDDSADDEFSLPKSYPGYAFKDGGDGSVHSGVENNTEHVKGDVLARRRIMAFFEDMHLIITVSYKAQISEI